MPPETDGAWEPTVTLTVDRETLHDGRGHTTPDDRDLFVIHGVLLYTGKLLLFCGHTESLFYAPVSYVFDPPTGTLARAPFPPDTDLFCCHYVQLADGRILAVGGSQLDSWGLFGSNYQYHGSSGAKHILVFDPQTEQWRNTGEDLSQGRWYPTAVLLGDGRVIVVSGRGESGGPRIADRVEVMAPPCYSPRRLENAEVQLPIYPGLHLMPDGRVYYTHTNWGQEIDEPQTMRLTVTGDQGTWHPLGGPSTRAQEFREEGMSVALPQTRDATQRGRILVVGGSLAMGRRAGGTPVRSVLTNPNAGDTRFVQTAGGDGRSAEVMDTKPATPTWTSVGPTTHPRINGHLVLLPDESVLVLGGHDNYKWQAADNVPGGTQPRTRPTLEVEFYREWATPRFSVGAPMAHPRMYHSVALLLNDGRVFVAGGADPNDFEPALTFGAGWEGRTYQGGRFGVPEGDPRLNGHGGVTLNRKDYQIYRPPYWFRTRPRLGSVSRTLVDYGETTVVTSLDAASITKVAIMRPGAVTHHTDSEQRYVELAFTRSGNDLTVTMPTERNLAPPGWYMIWIIDGERTPCGLAHFIRLGTPGPVCNDGWPCVVATVTHGSAEAPAVAYLRAARTRLAEQSPAGRRFVAVANAAYYSFSPQLARFLARHPRPRAAVRDAVVRPAVVAVRAAEAVARRTPAPQASFIVLLLLLAVLGVVAVPVWLAATAVLCARRPDVEADDAD